MFFLSGFLKKGLAFRLLFKEIAENLARQFNINDFKATNSLFDRWKVRNQIYFKKFMVKKVILMKTLRTPGKVTYYLQDLLQDFSSSCIYNCGETVLYYRAMPDRTLCLKGEKTEGGKIPKDRLTFLYYSNADGSHKMPLFIVGKPKKSQCFRGVKSLPDKSEANSNGWMTASLFKNWSVLFDNEMIKMK